MGTRFNECTEDLTVSDVDSTNNVSINDVIGNKEDTAKAPSATTSVISILKKIYELVLAGSGGGDPTQTVYVQVTSAADAATDTTLLTAADNVIVECVTVRANTGQTTDLTSCPVKAGTNKVLTIIDDKDGKQTNLDATDKQISWNGRIQLPTAGTIVMEHDGSGSTALDLTVSILYRGTIV